MSSYNNENTSSCFRQKQLAYRTSKKSDNTIQTCVTIGWIQKESRGEVVWVNLIRSFSVFPSREQTARYLWGLAILEGFLKTGLCQQKSTRVYHEEQNIKFYTAYIALGCFFLDSSRSVNIFLWSPTELWFTAGMKQQKKVEKYVRDDLESAYAHTSAH